MSSEKKSDDKKRKSQKTSNGRSERSSSSESVDSDLLEHYEKFKEETNSRMNKSNESSSSDENDVECKSFRELTLQTSDSVAVKTILEEPTYECFIRKFKKRGFNKIITMVGAGISTSAGIPDFRSPDKGIYSKLAKYNLPDPQAIFDIDYFKKRPEAFYDLAKELIPKVLKPTIAHCFIKLLELKGVLLRHYTQNIDGLERAAHLSEEKLIEAHGTFHTAHCVSCNASYSLEWLKQEMESTKVPTCVPCGGIVKPDIVFFGESLPKRFFEYMAKDFYEADLLIIMGSTLVVQPFASLVRRVHRKCPRIIINDKKVGATVGITYKAKYNTRDVFIKGKCDDGCRKIATSLGWEAELNDLVEQYQIEATSSQ